MIVVLAASVIIPIIFWVAVTAAPLSFLVFNSLMGLLCITLVVAFTVVGLNLIRVLRSTFHSLSHRMDKFLRKLLVYILLLDVLLILEAVTIALFTFFQAKRHATFYLLGHWTFRTIEFGIGMLTLVFSSKKEAKKTNNETSESVPRQSSLPNTINLESMKTSIAEDQPNV